MSLLNVNPSAASIDVQMNENYTHVWGDSVNWSSLTASTLLALDANKNMISTTVVPGGTYWQAVGSSTIEPTSSITTVQMPRSS
ncbi:unnamed protein product [Sphagnum jensenii]|uniref:Uncharacterized protein n=1 Tax=Sphagnum jensenii TaxID=128206 RepID=A0ABP0VBF1_9BRYO